MSITTIASFDAAKNNNAQNQVQNIDFSLITPNSKNRVLARNLYKFLELAPAVISRWLTSKITNNKFALENEDFWGVNILVEGNKIQDFEITPNFAKKLAMMSKSKMGEEVRNFYIQRDNKLSKIEEQNQIAVAPLPECNSDFMQLVTDRMKAFELKNAQLETVVGEKNAIIDDLLPKGKYFDISVNQNPENLSIQEITTIFLNQEKGITISTFEVWKILAKNEWIFHRKRNLKSETKKPYPNQKAKDNNWLTTTVERKSVIINGETGETKNFTNTQILITPSGRLELLKLVLENQNKFDLGQNGEISLL